MIASEPVLYRDAHTTVTPSRVVTGRETYSVANISAVKAGVTPPNRAPGLLLVLLSLVPCAALGVSDNVWVGLGGVAIGVLMMVGTLIWFLTRKPWYHVRLTTNAGEVRLAGAGDKERVEQVVTAINQALIRRGGGGPNRTNLVRLAP